MKRLLGNSSVGKNDLVLEVGPGKGIITKELLRVAGRVIAVERDPMLYAKLSEQFCHDPNLHLVCADFLSYGLPQGSYKVFANTPFAIEGKAIRKLIDASNPPEDCYVVMRKEVAERLSGTWREGQFSILHKPWFRFEIFHRFKRRDFTPKPKVESVVLRITKQTPPLLPKQEKPHYRQFIIRGFGGGRRIRQNLSSLFTRQRLSRLSQQLNISLDAKPSDLSFSQWLSLYRHKSRESVCYNPFQ